MALVKQGRLPLRPGRYDDGCIFDGPGAGSVLPTAWVAGVSPLAICSHFALWTSLPPAFCKQEHNSLSVC